jgi:hypothetical protein
LTAECALLSVGEEHDVFGMGKTKTNLHSFIFFVSSVFHSFPRYWFFTECFNMSNTTEPLVEQELPTVSEYSWSILDSFWWSSCFSSILSFLCSILWTIVCLYVLFILVNMIVLLMFDYQLLIRPMPLLVSLNDKWNYPI